MHKSVLATLIAGAFLMADAQAADLLQVYKEALANDAQFASARASLGAGEEKTTQGRSGLLPSIGANGGYSRTHSDTDLEGASFPSTTKGNSYTVQLTQPLFNWTNWEQYQQGKLTTASSEAQFELARQQLIVRVAQAYFDVLTAEDAITTLEAQKKATSEQLAQAKRSFEVGTTTITDTHEAQARYDLVVAQELAAQSDLDIKRAALQQIIGKQPGELAQLRPSVQLGAPQPAQIDQWVQDAQQRNPGVLAQQFGLEIAQREVTKARATRLPTVNLVAARNQSTSPFEGPSGISTATTTSNTIGVQWTIPIFQGFAISSHVRESIANEDKARADLETARRAAAQNARQAFFGVSSGLAQIKALEAAEVSSKSSLESNQLGYQVGVRINIDVLNAQQQLFQTQRDLASARYNTILNNLKLKAAAGVLSENDVAQVNALLKQ